MPPAKKWASTALPRSCGPFWKQASWAGSVGCRKLAWHCGWVLVYTRHNSAPKLPNGADLALPELPHHWNSNPFAPPQSVADSTNATAHPKLPEGARPIMGQVGHNIERLHHWKATLLPGFSQFQATPAWRCSRLLLHACNNSVPEKWPQQNCLVTGRRPSLPRSSRLQTTLACRCRRLLLHARNNSIPQLQGRRNWPQQSCLITGRRPSLPGSSRLQTACGLRSRLQGAFAQRAAACAWTARPPPWPRMSWATACPCRAGTSSAWIAHTCNGVKICAQPQRTWLDSCSSPWVEDEVIVTSWFYLGGRRLHALETRGLDWTAWRGRTAEQKLNDYKWVSSGSATAHQTPTILVQAWRSLWNSSWQRAYSKIVRTLHMQAMSTEMTLARHRTEVRLLRAVNASSKTWHKHERHPLGVSPRDRHGTCSSTCRRGWHPHSLGPSRINLTTPGSAWPRHPLCPRHPQSPGHQFRHTLGAIPPEQKWQI